MTDPDNAEEDRRIAEVMQIAESLAIGERQVSEVHDGYTRIGSATHGSFRFKWVAREQADGRYIIDETVGIGTVAVQSRPIPKDDVLAYIDERQRLHFQKVESVRQEWATTEKLSQPPVPVDRVDETQHVPVERDPVEMYDEIRRMLKDQK